MIEIKCCLNLKDLEIYRGELFKRFYYNGMITDYLVGNKGNIYKISKDKFLKQYMANSGHYRVCICIPNNKSKLLLVHRMVAQVFIENPNNLPVVDHIYGDKINNNADDLEWVTYSENNKRSFRLGSSKAKFGDCSPLSKYSEKDIYNACKLMESGFSANEVSKIVNIDDMYLLRIAHGEIWKHISKKFKFSNSIYSTKRNNKELIKKIKELFIRGLNGKQIRRELNLPSDLQTKTTLSNIKRRIKNRIKFND